jgi:CelD/BcsL family acetyltransferase involved in cellulose biosynthesis
MPETVGSQKNPFLQLPVSPNRSAAYITALGKNWDEYYAAKRSSANRKTSRKRQRQLEDEYGKLHFDEATDPKAAAHSLQILIGQKVQFLARIGAENIFDRPGYPEFYNAVVTSGSMKGLVHVAHLCVGPDEVGAVSVGFKHRDRFYLFLSSYHPGDMAKCGPGTLHLHELLQHCIETGLETFDFTIGDEPYKLDWAETKIILYDHVTAATASGTAAVLKARLERGAVRYLKRRAGLWHALKRARAIAGNWRRFVPGRAA